MDWAVTVHYHMPPLQLRIVYWRVLLLDHDHRVSGGAAITLYSNAGLAAMDKQG